MKCDTCRTDSPAKRDPIKAEAVRLQERHPTERRQKKKVVQRVGLRKRSGSLSGSLTERPSSAPDQYRTAERHRLKNEENTQSTPTRATIRAKDFKIINGTTSKGNTLEITAASINTMTGRITDTAGDLLAIEVYRDQSLGTAADTDQ